MQSPPPHPLTLSLSSPQQSPPLPHPCRKSQPLDPSITITASGSFVSRPRASPSYGPALRVKRRISRAGHCEELVKVQKENQSHLGGALAS